jgi:hypothetical protein
VAYVSLAGGTTKVIGWTREDARAVWTDANLAQIWVRDASVCASRSGYIAPLGSAQPTLPSSRTNSDLCEPDALARSRYP